MHLQLLVAFRTQTEPISSAALGPGQAGRKRKRIDTTDAVVRGRQVLAPLGSALRVADQMCVAVCAPALVLPFHLSSLYTAGGLRTRGVELVLLT